VLYTGHSLIKTVIHLDLEAEETLADAVKYEVVI